MKQRGSRPISQTTRDASGACLAVAWTLLLLALEAGLPAPARARENDPTVELSVAYYEPTFDTQLRFDDGDTAGLVDSGYDGLRVSATLAS